MSLDSGKSIHLVIRYSDALFGGVDTVDLHRQKIAKHGAAWIAKVGRPIGQDRIDKLNSQVQSNVPCFLYLVQKGQSRSKHVWSRGTIVHIQRNLPENEDHLIPDYYDSYGVFNSASTWFKISELADVGPEESSDLVVASSARPIHHSLHESMAAMFYVRRRG